MNDRDSIIMRFLQEHAAISFELGDFDRCRFVLMARLLMSARMEIELDSTRITEDGYL